MKLDCEGAYVVEMEQSDFRVRQSSSIRSACCSFSIYMIYSRFTTAVRNISYRETVKSQSTRTLLGR